MDRQERQPWSRRAWLAWNGGTLATLLVSRSAHASPAISSMPIRGAKRGYHESASAQQPLDVAPWQALLRNAVDAAMRAGARYADARFTRTVREKYRFQIAGQNPLTDVSELTGVSVRALVGSAWGFAATPFADASMISSLAEDAVTQARTNDRVGTPSPATGVELGPVAIATGTWTMPVRIDPFVLSLEEKWDMINGWYALSERFQPTINTLLSSLGIARQERVLATSDGSLCGQTVYESGARILFAPGEPEILGLGLAGKGWELFEDADIPAQLEHWNERIAEHAALVNQRKVMLVGRQTVICDGTTMASILDATLGTATQLDRALGYEANARGTSFLDDPVTMLGQFRVAAPGVTIAGSRSGAGELATVRWDDEGVEPQPFSLIRNGMLVDFQTTREQAAWLAPYYQRAGIPVQSRGCAATQDALRVTLQQSPNLIMSPANGPSSLEDLIASIPSGVLIEGGDATTDFQGRHGMINGQIRQIKNGRLGNLLVGGALRYDTADFWKNITAVGGPATMASLGQIARKGQPEQLTSHTITAPATIITQQAFVDPSRKA